MMAVLLNYIFSKPRNLKNCMYGCLVMCVVTLGTCLMPLSRHVIDKALEMKTVLLQLLFYDAFEILSSLLQFLT